MADSFTVRLLDDVAADTEALAHADIKSLNETVESALMEVVKHGEGESGGVQDLDRCDEVTSEPSIGRADCDPLLRFYVVAPDAPRVARRHYAVAMGGHGGDSPW